MSCPASRRTWTPTATSSPARSGAFRELVAEPADQFIDLFWVRLLPYVAVVLPGQELCYRLLVRNNLGRPAEYAARLRPPPGWEAEEAFATLRLEPGGRGEVVMLARAPAEADGVRRLMTAEVLIDGRSQGPLSEALVTVVGPAGQAPGPATRGSPGASGCIGAAYAPSE